MKVVTLGLIVSIAGACMAAPPARPALAGTAETLTVRKSSSTTAPREIVDAVPAGSSFSYGKKIDGKLRISQVGPEGLDVPGASAAAGDYLLQNELISVVVNAPKHINGNASSGGYTGRP